VNCSPQKGPSEKTALSSHPRRKAASVHRSRRPHAGEGQSPAPAEPALFRGDGTRGVTRPRQVPPRHAEPDRRTERALKMGQATHGTLLPRRHAGLRALPLLTRGSGARQEGPGGLQAGTPALPWPGHPAGDPARTPCPCSYSQSRGCVSSPF